MTASYVVRPLSPGEASDGARAWNDLADGTLDPKTVRKIETLLAESGSDVFTAFGAELAGDSVGSRPHALSRIPSWATTA